MVVVILSMVFENYNEPCASDKAKTTWYTVNSQAVSDIDDAVPIFATRRCWD
jgi:hypothetical protein